MTLNGSQKLTSRKMDSNKAQKIIEDACLILQDSKKYRSKSKQRKKKQQQLRNADLGNADGIQGSSRSMKYAVMNHNNHDSKVSEYRSNISSSINLCDTHEDFIRSVQSSNEHREKVKRPTTYCMMTDNICSCNECCRGLSFDNPCDGGDGRQHDHPSKCAQEPNLYSSSERFPTTKNRLDRLKIYSPCVYNQMARSHFYQGRHRSPRLNLPDNAKCNLNPRPMTQSHFLSSKFDVSPQSGKQRKENNGHVQNAKLQHGFGGQEKTSTMDKKFEERRSENLLSPDRFCTFKQSKVPKERSLSSFLQNDSQHENKERFWPASITSYNTDPKGKTFGSQYRLDGLLLDDFKFKSSQHYEIPKYIRQGNQISCNDGSGSALRLKKKPVRPTTDQIIGVGVNQRRF